MLDHNILQMPLSTHSSFKTEIHIGFKAGSQLEYCMGKFYVMKNLKEIFEETVSLFNIFKTPLTPLPMQNSYCDHRNFDSGNQPLMSVMK